MREERWAGLLREGCSGTSPPRAAAPPPGPPRLAAPRTRGGRRPRRRAAGGRDGAAEGARRGAGPRCRCRCLASSGRRQRVRPLPRCRAVGPERPQPGRPAGAASPGSAPGGRRAAPRRAVPCRRLGCQCSHRGIAWDGRGVQPLGFQRPRGEGTGGGAPLAAPSLRAAPPPVTTPCVGVTPVSQPAAAAGSEMSELCLQPRGPD